jgi:hypothetical protein
MRKNLIIGPSVIVKARQLYATAWHREWPFNDQYLRELAIEAKASLGLPANSRLKRDEVMTDTVVLMREIHEFPATN